MLDREDATAPEASTPPGNVAGMTQQPPMAMACYRHPDRATYIACQRCGRPICGDCMISAAVGFQCPECVREGARQTRQNLGPYGGERSSNPYLTTFVLIGINVAVWVAILLTGGAGSRLADLLALTPAGRCLSASQQNGWYPRAGEAACRAMSDGSWQTGAADGALWQVITTAFTHVEVLHIGANMLSLYFLGPLLERMIGRTRFLAVYFLSALAGSVTVMWFSDPQTTTLGASGAIFGLIGALVVVARKSGGDIRNLMFWLLLNLAITFYPGTGISWQGHIGGLVAGLVAAAIIAFAPRQNRGQTQVLGLAAMLAVLCVLLAVRILQLG